MKTLLCFVLLCLVLPLFAKHTLKPDTVLKKLAFGSCNKNDKPNHLWDEISKFDPQVWMWLGDIVYADSIWRSATIHDIRQKYALQKNITGYKNLISKTPEVLGVWDDHDFGKNNGGKEYHARWESQRVFLDFIDEPQDSPRWQQEGVYASYTFGPKGKQVKIIMLDTRYHRDDQWFGDILGEDQWKWFEQELKTTTSQITIITSGIQILPAEKPIQEKWNNYPSSYTKLMNIIRENKVGGVLFFSGDVHYGEMFKRDCNRERGVGYPLYEITSSGMTHSCKHQVPFGICEIALEHVMKSKYRYSEPYTDYNYGTLQIDWDSKPVMIHAQVRGVNGTALTLSVSLDELQPGASKGEDCSWENDIAHWRRWRFYVFQTSFGILAALGMTVGLSFLTCCLKRTVKPKKAQLSKNYLEKSE